MECFSLIWQFFKDNPIIVGDFYIRLDYICMFGFLLVLTKIYFKFFKGNV